MGEIFAGRYELVDPIGRGAVGAVWRTWDHRRRRYVAAKILQQSDAHTLLRFVREQALRIDHPHVLAPVSWAADDDKVLFTMDLVRGGSLAHLIGDYGPLAPGYVCTLLDQLLAGLAAVHAEGVVHRDVKPANVLLEATGTGRPHVRLSDFGVAMTKGEARLTETDYLVGTPGYFAPEQLLGAEPDFPADLFAVGLVALYLLSGHKPDAEALVARFDGGVPNAPNGVPEPLWQVVAGLLHPDPDQRFRTATGARKALTVAADALPEPDLDDEAIEVFDLVGPLPAGFTTTGPTRADRQPDSTGWERNGAAGEGTGTGSALWYAGGWGSGGAPAADGMPAVPAEPRSTPSGEPAGGPAAESPPATPAVVPVEEAAGGLAHGAAGRPHDPSSGPPRPEMGGTDASPTGGPTALGAEDGDQAAGGLASTGRAEAAEQSPEDRAQRSTPVAAAPVAGSEPGESAAGSVPGESGAVRRDGEPEQEEWPGTPGPGVPDGPLVGASPTDAGPGSLAPASTDAASGTAGSVAGSGYGGWGHGLSHPPASAGRDRPASGGGPECEASGRERPPERIGWPREPARTDSPEPVGWPAPTEPFEEWSVPEGPPTGDPPSPVVAYPHQLPHPPALPATRPYTTPPLPLSPAPPPAGRTVGAVPTTASQPVSRPARPPVRVVVPVLLLAIICYAIGVLALLAG